MKDILSILATSYTLESLFTDMLQFLNQLTNILSIKLKICLKGYKVHTGKDHRNNDFKDK